MIYIYILLLFVYICTYNNYNNYNNNNNNIYVRRTYEGTYMYMSEARVSIRAYVRTYTYIRMRMYYTSSK